MYFNPNAKWHSFTYKRTHYPSGTKVIYNGKCYLNDKEVILNNKIVTFLYDQDDRTYFQDNVNTYTCLLWEFSNRIVQIVVDKKPEPVSQKTEIYWTNDMVTKTLWYIIIMLAAVIFKDCIGIWILATIIWYNSTFKKNK